MTATNNNLMIELDGSQGEGGGQILRTALALSLVTGRPVTLDKIRARRKQPGLRRQHLTAVRAARQIGGAQVEGDRPGSTRLVFAPGAPRAGDYTFSIGTAGSTTLVAQTVLPALILLDAPSRLRFEGGTHNPLAPPFDFLAQSFLPLLGAMGPRVTADDLRYGFYPAGGGHFTLRVQPAASLKSLDILERGRLLDRRARAIVAALPDHIAERERKTVARKSGWPADCCRAERVASNGPGNAVILEMRFQHVTAVFTALGQRGKKAERVAADAWNQARSYLKSDAPVDPFLADQLLLPMALAAHRGQPCSLRTSELTGHARTQLDVLQQFLDVTIERHAEPGAQRVHILPAGRRASDSANP